MTSLKQRLEARLAFDEDKAIDNAPIVGFEAYDYNFVDGAEWQHEALTKELIPLITEAYDLIDKHKGYAMPSNVANKLFNKLNKFLGGEE